MKKTMMMSVIAATVLLCTAGASSPEAYTSKARYLDLMEKAVGAYTPEQITAYVEDAEKNMIGEHGFPRLAVNIGVLLANGRLQDKKEFFRRMMDVCCSQMQASFKRYKYIVGNDFSVKEVVMCLDEVARAGIFPAAKIEAWRSGIASLVPEKTYSCRPALGGKTAYNWCVFGAASEQARIWGGMNGDAGYADTYIADQLRFFDRNAMYKDPAQPVVYDMVTRLQFAAALYTGYNGSARAELERLMLKSADVTLLMLSASGEIPFGGRSNQFLHNETFYAALCEWYAAWFMKRGETDRARRFRLAARRAVDSLSYWLDRPSVRHIKNRYPLDTRYGCEKYGYFNKYMVTMGSWAYLAFRFADESVPAPVKETYAAADAASVFEMSEEFHRTLLNAGGYTAQFDVAADTHYDTSGLGRIQKRGAPPMLCLSVPFAVKPSYKLDLVNPTPLSILPGCRHGDGWHYAYNPGYRKEMLVAGDERAIALYGVKSGDMPELKWETTVSSAGVEMKLSGADELAFVLPVFLFDGERRSAVEKNGKTLTVTFDGWTCRYATSGEFTDTGLDYGNRNGRYRRYEARGAAPLGVSVEISRK